MEWATNAVMFSSSGVQNDGNDNESHEAQMVYSRVKFCAMLVATHVCGLTYRRHVEKR